MHASHTIKRKKPAAYATCTLLRAKIKEDVSEEISSDNFSSMSDGAFFWGATLPVAEPVGLKKPDQAASEVGLDSLAAVWILPTTVVFAKVSPTISTHCRDERPAITILAATTNALIAKTLT